MIRDSEFSNDAIGKFIQSDTVGRNQYLNTFIGALNSVSKNTYISVDANWGAGKTVFMKQIEYLNYCSLGSFNPPNLNHAVLSSFQDKYIVFYYNAWANDYHDDPLQSLLFSLIDKLYTDETRKEKVKALATKAVKSIAKETVKSLTKGVVNIDKISEATTVDDLVSSITTVNERNEAISNIISKILPDDKKLLFIIDELDRCNPEFAMRLLEVTKHYYNDDNIVFVLSTNNRQLVHTVKKYYGNNFDGYGYLDKLYDLILELPPVDIEQYFQRQLNTPQNSEWVNIVPVEIAKYFSMTMREANRYNALFSFIKGQLTNSMRWHSNKPISLLTSVVFVPLALALKIQDIESYDKFISGDSEALVRSLFTSNDVFQMIHMNGGDQEENPIDAAVESYKAMISARSLPYDRENYDTRQAEELFNSVLPLIASVSEIDNSEDGY